MLERNDRHSAGMGYVSMAVWEGLAKYGWARKDFPPSAMMSYWDGICRKLREWGSFMLILPQRNRKQTQLDSRSCQVRVDLGRSRKLKAGSGLGNTLWRSSCTLIMVGWETRSEDPPVPWSWWETRSEDPPVPWSRWAGKHPLKILLYPDHGGLGNTLWRSSCTLITVGWETRFEVPPVPWSLWAGKHALKFLLYPDHYGLGNTLWSSSCTLITVGWETRFEVPPVPWSLWARKHALKFLLYPDHGGLGNTLWSSSCT